MDNYISQNNLKGTFAYVDDVTLCGLIKKEHDEDLEKFMEAGKRYGITLNIKGVFFSNLLGYEVRHKDLRPDPDRLSLVKKLLNLQTKTKMRLSR